MIKSMQRALLAVSVSFLFAPGAVAQSVAGTKSAQQRPVLEQQFRERVAKLAKARIGLSDAQMAQLEQSTARFAPQLNQVMTEERATRRELRQQLTAQQPNQQRVNELLDASLRLQKQRIAIVEAEQKDLARFMTPVQRARYIALQQQFRRRAQELSGQRNGGPRPGPRRIR